ncbi:hypothetical protein [Cupriavidus oxalaticus]|uniref:Uncharacterized protein n=1 Tax=Cupriavidus oxalaticus TaxID=96344 RepID=A0A5P3VQT5_9BURK|nr:hypothetical protein [Cupriavidus oxalaticus]QEZ48754.1 hypothetical protein D2917_31210 [Cupriavidus oxalaticus]
MRSRDVEAALLSRCATVARERTGSALDQREANVFRLAAMVVQSSFPREAARLMQASEDYFAAHPSERLPAHDVVTRGWVTSLPRLHGRLSQTFRYQ